MKRVFLFNIVFLLSYFSNGQNLPNDCVNYIQACDNQNVAFDVSGAGVQEIIPPSCSSNENNSLWLRVTIDQPGKLGFTIVPESTNLIEDYDFWVFGPNVTCGALGTPIRCSTTNPLAAGLLNNHTGLNETSTDMMEGPGEDGDSFVQELNVLSGESYFIVIDRPVGNSPFILTWTGSATIANPFDSYNFQDFDEIVLCDEDGNRQEDFDFSTLTEDYLIETSGEFTISYFRTFQSASLNLNPLIGLVNVNSGTFYARVSDSLTSCYIIKSIPLSLQRIQVNSIQKNFCSNAITQNVIVDLGSFEDEIYTGNETVSFTFFENFEDAESLLNQLTNWQSVTLPVGLHDFYVSVTQGNCIKVVDILIEVVQTPVVNTNVALQQCDDDSDGFSAFNLTQANELLIAESGSFTFDYFLSFLDAEANLNRITNIQSFVNPLPSSSTIFVRVTNSTGCYAIESLELVVSTTLIPFDFIEVFTECDDLQSGSNSDGIATFDFSSFTDTLLDTFPSGQQLSVTYYETIEDALAEINAIQNITNYTNSGSPFTQEIFVRLDSELDNSCVGLGHHITLQIEAIPIINPFQIRGCDEDGDGFYNFDTVQMISDFLGELSNVRLEFRDKDNVLLPNPLPNPFITAGETIYVTIENQTTAACSFETTITFILDKKPEANAINSDFTTVCDDEINPLEQNGSFGFDTSGFQATILNGQTGVFVEYYDETNLQLPSPLPNPFITSSQIITAKVINENNPDCFEIVEIPFVVNPTPRIELEGAPHYVCIDITGYQVSLDAALNNPLVFENYTYQWFFNQIAIPNATSYSIDVAEAGTYSVEVTSLQGCVKTRTIPVFDSQMAVIENVEVNDLIDQNSIIVTVAGIGNYQYSIDGVNYQESNTFYNLVPGIVKVYVYDLHTCGIATVEVSVLGIPKFFTPNGDGSNDLWNLLGLNNLNPTNALISVFNRYGKLIYQFSSQGSGWDGTFNGRPLPSDDYWFLIELEDGKTKRGHFSLKR
jgi:gliding motility-associated-like protein